MVAVERFVLTSFQDGRLRVGKLEKENFSHPPPTRTSCQPSPIDARASFSFFFRLSVFRSATSKSVLL